MPPRQRQSTHRPAYVARRRQPRHAAPWDQQTSRCICAPFVLLGADVGDVTEGGRLGQSQEESIAGH